MEVPELVLEKADRELEKVDKEMKKSDTLKVRNS
jgi:hypothetical protein